MNEIEKTRGAENSSPTTVPDVDPNRESSQERLDQAARLLAASRSAIEKALSGDSERFLQQTRQQGGQ